MSDVDNYIAAIKNALNDGPTPGEWHPGHLGEDCKCQCRSITCDSIAGGIATVLIDNGLSVGEGGNDCPDAKEAAANMRFIAACNTVAMTAVLAEIDRLRAENAELRQQLVETRGKALDEAGWQPIETAPKDGTPVLASTDEYDEPLILRWQKYNGLATWRDWDMDSYHRATHWLPIPAPPSRPRLSIVGDAE